MTLHYDRGPRWVGIGPLAHPNHPAWSKAPGETRQQARARARTLPRRDGARVMLRPDPVLPERYETRGGPLGGKAHEHQRKPIRLPTPGKPRRFALVEVPELYRGAGYKAARAQRAKRHAFVSGGALWWRGRHARAKFRAQVRADGLRKVETR